MNGKPNIIFITTDQQRYDSLAINGASFMNTPNLDKIGVEGALFSRAYCTNPVCTPSRVSMMTGNHISRHGAYNIGTYPVDQSEFLSYRLRENGYYNCHIGKAHWNAWGELNDETREVDKSGAPFKDFMGFHQAEFSIGHGYQASQKSHYAAWLRNKGISPEKYAYHSLFENDAMETGDWELPKEFHSGAWIVERVISFLENRNKKQPFYLNIGFPDPHHPHTLPFDFENKVSESELPQPNLTIDRENECEPTQKIRNGVINQSRFIGQFKVAGNGDDEDWEIYFQDEKKSSKTRAYYYSMVQLLDEQIGELLNYLERKNLLDETILIFTSDHGEMLGDHLIGQKGPLVYEEVLRVPLMIRYPKQIRPQVVDSCVSLVDLFPTIMDCLNIQDHNKRDGVSLNSMLQGSQKIPRNGVRVEYKEEPDRIRFKCWITKEWKLALYLGESFGELYNLTNDREENHNLFNDPEYQDKKNELIHEMLIDMERSDPISRRPSRV